MCNIKNWFEYILKKDLLYKMNINNSYDVPSLGSINLSVYSKSSIDNPKNIIPSIIMLKIITNQKPTVIKAKKSVAAFKIRKNMIIGCKVRLRKVVAYNFFNTLMLLSLAKVKKQKYYSIDKQGNVAIGLDNIFIFPQLLNHYEKIPKNTTCMLNISFVNSSYNFTKLILTGLQFPAK